MKRSWIFLLACFLWGCSVTAEVQIKQMDLSGRLSEDEFVLAMDFKARVTDAPVRMVALEGEVLPTDVELPRGAELVKEGGLYYIDFNRNGRHAVSIRFEAKVTKNGQQRVVEFVVPEAAIRQLTLQTEQEDCRVDVQGAPQAEKLDATRIQAFLPSTGSIRIGWQPELEKLSGELVASCDSLLIGTAKVGALQLQGHYVYTIPQGRMKALSMKLPADLNIIQVMGEDLLAWGVQEHGGKRLLTVDLSRPQEKSYVLTVLAEQSLADFPCRFIFPVMEPQGVIRANGALLVGTDSTLKLLVDELSGVTQIEPDAVDWAPLSRPKRGLYAYMFANMPFSMRLSADNIMTSLHAQDQLVLALSENDASLEAQVDLEIRDAPARDVEFEISRDWTVTGVTGQNVADYDVRDRDGARWIRVYFKKEVASRALIRMRLEKVLPEDARRFEMPRFRVAGAKSERGFLVLRGETGTRVEGVDLSGLREVNTGSLPIQIADARQAFRFKRADWAGQISVFQEKASVHVESFQLVSLGESGVFGSSLITYNIANAPTRSFTLRIPSIYRNVEVLGRDIRNWTQDGEQWTIHLQQKVIGDYTLLVTYDHPAQYQGEELSIGGVYTPGVESETGYIALAGAANLSVEEELEHASTLLPIDVDEVPDEYALLVNDPIMHAYKYVAAPHEAVVQIKRFAIQPLLTQVADHITLNTDISKDGEAVTVATYHVKNTDRQYLPLHLPGKASLWSVKVDNSKIQVMDRGDGQLLVPVERRRDPNAPIKIEVTYAEQLNKPGLYTQMKFKSPKVDSQSVFSRWTFRLPDGRRLISAKGNMELPAALSGRRAEWGRLVSRFGPGKGIYALIVCAVTGAGLFFIGKRRGGNASASFSASVVSACVLMAVVAAGFLLLDAAFSLAGSVGQAPAEWEFSKAVSGSEDGLSVRLTLAGASFQLLQSLLLFAAGLIPLVWMMGSGRRRGVLPALALCVALCSFSPYLAWLTLSLPTVLFAFVCYRTGWRQGRNQKEFQAAQHDLFALDAEPMTGKEGFVRPRCAGVMLAVCLVAAGCAAMRPAAPAPTPEKSLKAETIDLQIAVPEFETESRVNVAVHMEVALTAEKGEALQMLGPDFILMDYELSSRHLRITTDEAGSFLRIDRSGEYTVSVDYLVSADDVEGSWSTAVWVPDALQNHAQIQFAAEGWVLKSPQAVRIRQQAAVADVLLAPDARLCTLRWVPEERKTDREPSRFFCDVNTLADFRPGMVGLQHQVQFNIAQGELKSLELDVPAGMSITEVRGDTIGTWRYDPEENRLEVVLSVPATESYRMQVGAQIARRKLPYEAVVQGITVRDAVMQRGIVALASSAAVQVDLVDAAALSGINTADAAALLADQSGITIKRAFRYNSMPFSATVAADEVLPELRLEEVSSLDLASEQVRLSSRLNLTVTKSGIFSLRIRIPDGVDVDSLSGESISHWDEVTAGTHELVVHFDRQITGAIPLNLVLSRSGRDLAPEFAVPRIQMDGVLKHTGSLVVTVERGIRVTPLRRDGVSEISPRELGIRQAGSLAYRLLRPDWAIDLQSEVMAPKIKAEVLQRVALSEGMLKARCYLQYDIEHAGVKSFRVQTPSPEVALVVSGRNVSRVRKVDDANGIWEVELHGKVETHYSMEAAYQLPLAADSSELVIQPLKTIGTESQKGYVTVMSSGRLQVKPTAVPDFMRPEDARSIPRRFGAGDLSDAVLCYRTTESDFEMTLHVVRHQAADVLPAQVKSVRLDSVITQENQSLNHMTMTLEPGSLRFLDMTLPDGAEIWAVFVNETAVRPLVEAGVYLIPIEPGAELLATVEVMYAQTGKQTFLRNHHVFSGPQFKLPLTDVVWTFYAPNGYRYSRFDGTMEYQKPASAWAVTKARFDELEYYDYNSSASLRFGASAKENIVKGNQLMQSGDQRSARKAFQKAISYSQGQQALNEDARVQFRNLVRQQGVAGLVSRRNQLRQTLNQGNDVVQIPDGNTNWSVADIEKIQLQLGEKESSSLSALAEKMLDQQQAASVEVHPIRIVMPEQGTALTFERTLQLKPNTEMKVEFNSAKTTGNRAAHLIVVMVLIGATLLFGRAIGISKAEVDTGQGVI